MRHKNIDFPNGLPVCRFATNRKPPNRFLDLFLTMKRSLASRWWQASFGRALDKLDMTKVTVSPHVFPKNLANSPFLY